MDVAASHFILDTVLIIYLSYIPISKLSLRCADVSSFVKQQGKRTAEGMTLVSCTACLYLFAFIFKDVKILFLVTESSINNPSIKGADRPAVHRHDVQGRVKNSNSLPFHVRRFVSSRSICWADSTSFTAVRTGKVQDESKPVCFDVFLNITTKNTDIVLLRVPQSFSSPSISCPYSQSVKMTNGWCGRRRMRHVSTGQPRKQKNYSSQLTARHCHQSFGLLLLQPTALV